MMQKNKFRIPFYFIGLDAAYQTFGYYNRILKQLINCNEDIYTEFFTFVEQNSDLASNMK